MQRLALSDFGGVGDTSPRNTLFKEGDNSIKAELKYVQSTKRETTTRGTHDLRPQSQICTANRLFNESSSKDSNDTDDTASSLAE